MKTVDVGEFCFFFILEFIFWAVTPCQLVVTDVSKKRTASTYSVSQSKQTD